MPEAQFTVITFENRNGVTSCRVAGWLSGLGSSTFPVGGFDRTLLVLRGGAWAPVGPGSARVVLRAGFGVPPRLLPVRGLGETPNPTPGTGMLPGPFQSATA